VEAIAAAAAAAAAAVPAAAAAATYVHEEQQEKQQEKQREWHSSSSGRGDGGGGGRGVDDMTEVERVWSSDLASPHRSDSGEHPNQHPQQQRVPRSVEEMHAAEQALDAEFAEAFADPDQSFRASQRLAGWWTSGRPGLAWTERTPHTGGNSIGGGGDGGGSLLDGRRQLSPPHPISSGGFSKEAIEIAARAAVEAALAAAQGGRGARVSAASRHSQSSHVAPGSRHSRSSHVAPGSRHSRSSRSHLPYEYDVQGRRSDRSSVAAAADDDAAAATAAAKSWITPVPAHAPTRLDVYEGGEAGRNRLLQARSTIESMSGYPPAVATALRRKKKVGEPLAPNFKPLPGTCICNIITVFHKTLDP
jgi:hypothetical protein